MLDWVGVVGETAEAENARLRETFSEDAALLDGYASEETRSRGVELDGFGVATFTSFWRKLGAIHEWAPFIFW